VMGYSMTSSASTAWHSGKAEVFLDALHQSRAEFLPFAVHRQHGQERTVAHDKVPAVTGFKRAALALQPALELPTRHVGIRVDDGCNVCQQKCCILN
jgi:hypothetical protein